MNLFEKHYADYNNLLQQNFTTTKKISVILPARNEYETIGNYLPQFADLMRKGLIYEIILVDSSDDSRTINSFLNSAIQTEPYATLIAEAKKNNSHLPIQAVSVFDPQFTKLFGKKKIRTGKAPGKGRTMYVGIAIATGDYIVFLDSDFYNIHPRFLNGLIGPLLLDNADFVKATFELEDEWHSVIDYCNVHNIELSTCSKLLNSCVSRNLAKPLTRSLVSLGTHTGIDKFKGPLSGGYAAPIDVWRTMKIPTRYGVEIYSLMEIARLFPDDSLALDVNLGVVEQTSTELQGKTTIGKNIVGAFFRNIQERFPSTFKKLTANPELFKNLYLQFASENIVHVIDAEQVVMYAELIEERLKNPSILKKTLLLPKLSSNKYFKENFSCILQAAKDFSFERMELLSENLMTKEIVVLSENTLQLESEIKS